MRYDILSAKYKTSDGREIVWGVDGNNVLTGISGISGIMPEITTVRSPLSDGERLQRMRFPQRVVTINAALLGTWETFGEMRRQLLGTMNPKLMMGELTVYGYGKTLRAPAYVSDMPSITESHGGMEWFTYVCEITVPGAFWLAESESVVTMQSYAGGFGFETTLPAKFAVISGANTVDVNVESDVPCPVVMEFSGGSRNPRVTNEATGETIRINTNIPQGSSLVIDTERGSRTAYLRASDGTITSAMGFLDVTTRFFDLQPGHNSISFAADEGMAAEASIRWTNRYVGF